MSYLIGADEAGYGPNLGPLLVAASVWHVPDDVHSSDLGPRLADAVTDDLRAANSGGNTRVVMGDSKRLYQSGQGWQHLEAGLWPALSCIGPAPRSWREVWQALAPEVLAEQSAMPWFGAYEATVPRDAAPDRIANGTVAFRAGLQRAGVRLVGLRARGVFPREFNRLLARCDSKGTLLSQTTLQLVGELLAPLPDEPLRVLCDKHGGRSRYQTLLADLFPDCFIEICGESLKRSVYRLGPPQRRVEFRFEARSESYLPTALASMTAKYLRELAMEAWNAFWIGHLPGLAPTAGYPQDARRFKAAIAPLQKKLGFDDEALWRVK